MLHLVAYMARLVVLWLHNEFLDEACPSLAATRPFYIAIVLQAC